MRITKGDIEFLCKTTMDLAFVAQRINRQLSKGGKPKAGTEALKGFRSIDVARLKRLSAVFNLPQIGDLVDCYDEVLESEKNGWTNYVFRWAWKPELYDIKNPTKSMSVEKWGMVKGKTDYGVSDHDACTVPLSWRLSQHGQVKTILDVAKSLNEAYAFKDYGQFHTVLFEAIIKAMHRGSIAKSAFHIVTETLRSHADEYFRGGKLNFMKYAEEVEAIFAEDEPSPIDHIFLQRHKTLFLRVAALMNDVMRYDSPDEFVDDMKLLTSDNGYSPLWQYRLICEFVSTVQNRWPKLLDANKVLSSSKMEKYFNGNHSDALKQKTLEKVLESDFISGTGVDGEEIKWPKKEFSAPIYVLDKHFRDHCGGNPTYVKTCGFCGSVMDPELFEFECIMPIVEREVSAGNYIKKDKYYIPRYDDSLPIFLEDHGRVHFDMMHDQLNFMHRYRETGRIPDVDIR